VKGGIEPFEPGGGKTSSSLNQEGRKETEGQRPLVISLLASGEKKETTALLRAQGRRKGFGSPVAGRQL